MNYELWIMNKFFLQRRIPACRQAGASGGQFSIINFSFKEGSSFGGQ